MKMNIIKSFKRKLIEKLLTTLPREYTHGLPHYQYDGAWHPSMAIPGAISSQQLFQADESDIILATLPKSGTTWLKALIFSIVNRNRYAPKDSPLLSIHPHDVVCNLELEHFRDGVPQHLDQRSRPRIFNTHVPYASLPPIMASNCRNVCVCRNPLDSIVSYWHFIASLYKSFFVQPNPIDELFHKYCEGVHYYGPFWNHNLGYWNASLERPENVLFMTYEDLKADIIFQTKRLATFLGSPFAKQEEDEGLVEEIYRLCSSLGNLKSLDVNKKGLNRLNLPASAYFRKGEVGDYANHLTPSMIQNLNKVVQDKFAGSGLVLKLKTENNSAAE